MHCVQESEFSSKSLKKIHFLEHNTPVKGRRLMAQMKSEVGAIRKRRNLPAILAVYWQYLPIYHCFTDNFYDDKYYS